MQEKNAIENVKKNLEAGFKVIVACESKLTKEKIEKKLRKAEPKEKPIVIEANELLEKPLTRFIPFISLPPPVHTAKIKNEMDGSTRSESA